MKSLIAIALIATAAPAFAQTKPAPAPAPAATPAAPAPAATTAKFTLDTPIVDLIGDPAANAVLLKDLGNDVSKHPSYESFKAMSLTQVAPYSNGLLTDEKLKQLATDLAAIK